MSKLKDTFFGGAEKKAGKAEVKAFEQGQQLVRQGQQQARSDIQGIFPQAQQSLLQGFQGALDVFGQSVPAQADVFQQGNLVAQQSVARGLPQFQNAILGQPVDFNQFQPQQIQAPDLSFLQQQLPQLAQLQQAEQQGFGPQAPAPNPFDRIGADARFFDDRFSPFNRTLR